MNDTIDTNKQEAIQSMLQDYARSTNFFISQDDIVIQDSNNKEIQVYNTPVENPYCRDLMEIYIYKVDNKAQLFHFGNYCSLAHMSAELLCTITHNIAWTILVQLSIVLKEYIKTGIIIDKNMIETQFSELDMLMNTSMSPARKQCIILPWIAITKALI